jgi:hypothetical protein
MADGRRGSAARHKIAALSGTSLVDGRTGKRRPGLVSFRLIKEEAKDIAGSLLAWIE